MTSARSLLAILLATTVIPAAAASVGGFADPAAPVTSTADLNRDEVLSPTFGAAINGGVVVSGCGFRGTGPPVAAGTISIGPLPADATVLRATLNWTIVGDVTPSADVTFHEISAPPTVFAGTPLGSDEPPCWAPLTGVYAFTADVTAAMTASGEGDYRVELPDSGTLTVHPSAEGAALIVVYCSPSSPGTDIVVYEGVETQSSGDTIQTVTGFDASTPLDAAAATFIVADGQGFGGPGRPGSAGYLNTVEVIPSFDGDEGASCGAQHGLYYDVDTVDAAPHMLAGDTSLVAAVESFGDCLTWSGLVLAVSSDTVDNAAAGCPDVSPCPPDLDADAGPELTICAGESVTLDGSASAGCSAAGREYRWLDGAVVACDWSSDPTCDLSPLDTTTYTLEVRCVDRPECVDSSTTRVVVTPDVVPPDLGNSVRAVRDGLDVVLTWWDEPLAVSFSLYRTVDKLALPGGRLRAGLADPTATEPDVPAPPELYLYQAVGASCSGRE